MSEQGGRRRAWRLVDRGAASLEQVGVTVVAVLVALGLLVSAHLTFAPDVTSAFCRAVDAVARVGLACQDAAAAPSGEVEAPYEDREWSYTGITSGPMVFIGDSYGSGEGAGDYSPGTDNDPNWWDRLWGDDSDPNTCHRSANAWGVAVGEEHWGSGNYSFQACSGATTDEVTDPNGGNPGEGPQADSITPDTTMIFVSMGGNDVGFAPILTDCLAAMATNSLNRSQSGGWLPQSALVYCSDYYSAVDPDDPGGRTRVQVRLDRLEADLREMYRELRRRSGDGAHIVHMGYPQLLDPGYVGLIEARDVAFLNEMGIELNALMAQVAEEEGVHFVDPTEAFTGHGVGSDDPWILGLGIGQHHAWPPETFRPSAEGQEALRRLVEDYLAGLP
ncbi:SGNH/GDSL hydrolase family protein [Ornithinimicrobium avium]|uniref:SGNH/GDSL hydrolase family protein n=1 Tax=Ornithinimicrobium avium TaxID=2283195 RepID=A0A345NRV5_9MICO|nr:SGNH/GDSL hydrolase family protein [Ornithinimicrobium avium]AXH97763.1 SGNH/GDSL hydrolase family protein [Ornithinimicrobium avium]